VQSWLEIDIFQILLISSVQERIQSTKLITTDVLTHCLVNVWDKERAVTEKTRRSTLKIRRTTLKNSSLDALVAENPSLDAEKLVATELSRWNFGKFSIIYLTNHRRLTVPSIFYERNTTSSSLLRQLHWQASVDHFKDELVSPRRRPKLTKNGVFSLPYQRKKWSWGKCQNGG
jgi:hypothetical protein